MCSLYKIIMTKNKCVVGVAESQRAAGRQGKILLFIHTADTERETLDRESALFCWDDDVVEKLYSNFSKSSRSIGTL